MKSSNPGSQERPAGDLSARRPLAAKLGMPSTGDAPSTIRQAPPVQSGTQYGGNGQGDAAVGRDSGRSSDEGGQCDMQFGTVKAIRTGMLALRLPTVSSSKESTLIAGPVAIAAR